MKSSDLLELALKRQGCNPHKLALLIETRPSEIYGVRAGKKPFTDHDLFAICDLINEDPAKWLPVVEAERSKNPKERAAWERIAKLTSTAFALILAVTVSFPEKVEAAPAYSDRMTNT